MVFLAERDVKQRPANGSDAPNVVRRTRTSPPAPRRPNLARAFPGMVFAVGVHPEGSVSNVERYRVAVYRYRYPS